MIQKKPREYLEHVRKKGSDCPYHQILYQFLKLIFKDFYEPGRKHLGFYKAQSKDYKAAARWVKENQRDTAIPEPPSRPLKVLQPLKRDLGPGQERKNIEEAIKTLTPKHEAIVSHPLFPSLVALTPKDQAWTSSVLGPEEKSTSPVETADDDMP